MIGFLCKAEHTESAIGLLIGLLIEMRHKGRSPDLVTCNFG